MTQKPPPMPDFDVPAAVPESGRLTTVWWEWLQQFVRWNEAGGAAITQTDADTRYVDTTGDTMSGNLTIATDNARLYLNKTAVGQNSGIFWQQGGAYRWTMYSDNVVEGGSNVGSNFNITRYTDAGAAIDTPLTINRATGTTTLSGDLIQGKDTAGVSRRHYFDIAGKHAWHFNHHTDGKFYIARHDPTTGTALDNPISIDGATGIVTANGLAPTPTAAAVAGQWQTFNSTAGGALVLPAGGTWAYAFTAYMSTTSVWAGPFSASLAAGGTTIGSATPNVIWTGFRWRIA